MAPALLRDLGTLETLTAVHSLWSLALLSLPASTFCPQASLSVYGLVTEPTGGELVATVIPALPTSRTAEPNTEHRLLQWRNESRFICRALSKEHGKLYCLKPKLPSG